MLTNAKMFSPGRSDNVGLSKKENSLLVNML